MILKLKEQLQSSLIFLVSLVLFVCFVPGQEVIGFDSRFYLFVREMWQNGLSWFPTTYGEPYPDYTAASTVVIYGFAKLFGGVSKFVGVLPSAILAALTVSLTYKIAALHDKRWGLASVAMLFLTLGFMNAAMSISLDMYTVFFTTLVFYLLHHAAIKAQSVSLPLLMLIFSLSFVFRGPIGLVIPFTLA
jgi:4-amino-4-deoxy-L-arabinose transferase-like glycosyltransferase